MKKNKGNAKATPPARTAHRWEHVSFKVTAEMKVKIKADMEVTDSHTEAEYFRFLLRQRFERVK